MLFLFQPAPDGVDHRLLVGELAGLQLRVEQLAVDAQLETAAARGNQLQVLDLLFVGREQFGRQTDGLRLIVSHRTIFEFQMHEVPFHLPTSSTGRLCLY
jgi:hypothetical protein